MLEVFDGVLHGVRVGVQISNTVKKEGEQSDRNSVKHELLKMKDRNSHRQAGIVK